MKSVELTKEHLNTVRKVEGFPIGKDEDIIALSKPPQFTACPNPFITDFIKKYGTLYNEKEDTYHREPFAFDVSEGKSDTIYKTHSYHTKVPHKAIMRYILHYTEPGDIVFDGFCGTGMTSVAAQMCSSPDKEFKQKIETEMPNVKWGARKTILCDLSPAATFIAYNYNASINIKEFTRDVKDILDQVEKECSWMYETQHMIEGKPVYQTDIYGERKPAKGKIKYVVWSDVFSCPSCNSEIVFWDTAVDKQEVRVLNQFKCPHCDVALNKRSLERVWEIVFDEALQKTTKRAKQLPVMIKYIIEENIGKKKKERRYEKKPDAEDLALIKKIEEDTISYIYPVDPLPEGYNTEQPKRSHGFTHIHHFYTKRNLRTLATFWHKSTERQNVSKVRWMITSMLLMRGTKRLPYRKGGKGAGAINNLYLPSLVEEDNVIDVFKRKYRLNFSKIKSNLNGDFIVTTQSSHSIKQIPNNSIDYIFTDPPFGSNIMYSELNYFWESWLRVFTDNKKEAIVNKSQKKKLSDYQIIMEQCFKENHRILKPGRWMTVEFHNSKNSVWIAIQEALMRAGFVVADVRTLDKKWGSFKQVTTTSAVKQDLVISAYKPSGGLEKRFIIEAGTEEGVWSFVRQHLKYLPVFVEKGEDAEIIAERQNYMLFDRMVAFHVQRGIHVPISTAEFYIGLQQRFPERDGMYFLPDQVSEYDRKFMSTRGLEQLSLFVHDEKSAVQWLRQELKDQPQTYQKIQPKFLQKLLNKDKHEKLPELLEVLKQNFLIDENNRWYVPDPNKQTDLERLREKALLREFEEYTTTKKRLRLFRTEAVRAGFKRAWADKDYDTIIKVGDRLPTLILREDSTLLMYYDNAVIRVEVV